MGDSNNSQVDWILSRKNDSANTPIAPRPDADYYKKHKHRGIAIIFNQKVFSMKDCPTRLGTDKDRDDLKGILTMLKFDVKIYNDLTYDEIVEVLTVVSRMDHANHDCLLITVMSHGDEGILYATDRAYPTRRLWLPFSGMRCPSLAAKPKLFFIQACRGAQSDPGIKVSYTETDSSIDEKMYSIPVTADVLIMYSTVAGYYSWRDPENGSFFIQSLVRQLRKHHRSRDLLSILTCVNREVAIGFTSKEDGDPLLNDKKEMCSIVSMLTRLLYLD
ncbi:hypothetical protein NQ317_019940 [Molorchus minor]|uniref:Caspase-3 n=1 Tax=Molorchus minor TaxID=1323400 RepID=A0ABQ9K6A5_9CUCU|nr:hypothetical protein NQ317_019940 [Molorchus minor]